MRCFLTATTIAKQVAAWVLGFVSWLQQLCTSITQTFQHFETRVQQVCSQVQSRVCQSLPWPLSAFCSLVTSLVCSIVTAVISVIETVIQVICTIVTVILAVLLLLLVIVLYLILLLLCVIVPCRAPMESSFPPDAGWLVTLGGSTPPALSRDNLVGILTDGEAACNAMVRVIDAAEHTVHLFQLEFDADPHNDPDKSFIAVFGRRNKLLTQVLIDASARGVAVRILMNQNLIKDNVKALQAAFSGHPGIEVRGVSITPVGMMHAKGMFVDGATAFIDGLPFAQGYWDTQMHLVTDPRRGEGAGGDVPFLGDIGNGVGKKPVHTVSLRIDGPAAADVDSTFVGLWNSVAPAGDTVPLPTPTISPFGAQSVQIVRSTPRLLAAGIPRGEEGVLEAYLRAINNAKDFIYVEMQYFNALEITDALIRALGGNRTLQLILLLNENPDMPTYEFWQNTLLEQFSAIPEEQVGVFALWRTARDQDSPQPQITQCYMEAKVVIVDDVWASVGSANIDGASLGHMYEFLPPPMSCLSAARGWRNFELNAILYDGTAGQPVTGCVPLLRTTLWQEHLGPAAISADPTAPPPAAGWLNLWKAIARQNIASLNATQMMTGGDLPSRILPYTSALDTVAQLTALGVDTNLFAVAPAVPK